MASPLFLNKRKQVLCGEKQEPETTKKSGKF